ncbi:MAG: arsenate reductase ArsC [Bryobacterales bacterium]
MKILILCTGNSCRSQMAEAFLRSFDPSLEVESAGSRPAEQVNPHAVRVMAEVGLDLSGQRPKSVAEFLDQPFDYVITVCGNARDECPAFTGQVEHRVHLGFDDPADATGSEEEILDVFRRSREEIRDCFYRFYQEDLTH